MGFKQTTLQCAIVLALGLGTSYADTVGNNPAPQSATIKALKVQLNAMQAQLNELAIKVSKADHDKRKNQQTIKTLTTKVTKLQQSHTRLVHRSKQLGILAKAVSRSSVHFDGETGEYFETLPSGTMADALLVNRDKFKQHALTIGGNLETDVQRWFGDSIPATKSGNGPRTYRSGYGVSISCFDIDFLALINHWVSVYGSIAGTPSPGVFKPDIDQAFFTLGNLDKYPLYVSVGKMHIPFGAFTATGPASYPLTHAAFHVGTQTQVLVGYHHKGLSTMLSAFNDQTSSVYHRQVDFAYSVNYTLQANKALKFDFGGGYVHNLVGLGGVFPQNSTTTTKYPKGMPAWDANLGAIYGMFGLTGEYIRGFQTNTLSKRPAAWSTGASIMPMVYGAPLTFALSYSATVNMKDLPMSPTGNPTGANSLNAGIKNAWIGYVSRQFFNHSLNVGLDMQYIKTYDNKHSTTASIDTTVYF